MKKITGVMHRGLGVIELNNSALPLVTYLSSISRTQGATDVSLKLTSEHKLPEVRTLL